MFRIELHEGINKIINLFYRLKIWHRGDEPTIWERRIQWFYSIYHLLFPVCLMSGAIKTESKDERVFLLEATVGISVLSLKMLYLIWKQKQIIEVLQEICVYSVEDQKDFINVNDKLKKFMKFVYVLMFAVIIAHLCIVFIIPICGGSDNKLFINIGFPLDWKNNRIAFLITNIFFASELILSDFAILFSVLVWYLLIHCVLRYDALGNEIRNMGAIKVTETTANKRKILDVEKQKIYLGHLTTAIDSHGHTKGLVNKLGAFLSIIFFSQIITSGLCICCSVYCLAFNVGENLVECGIHVVALLYNLSEIFMIMYFGNEIMFSSDKLSHCLFESKWVDQPQSTKKLILIFGELLQQPHVLVIGYLYPLTLETFRRIVNSAYNMFNILKNLK